MATSSASSGHLMVVDGCFRTQLSLIRHYHPHEEDGCQNQLLLNTCQPDLVKRVHMAFLKAGANVIRTNTYWASELYVGDSLQRSVNDLWQLIDNSVQIARNSIRTHIAEVGGRSEDYKVAGLCGSATNTKGICVSKLDVDRVKNFHRLRAKLLLRSGVDMLAFESIESSEEANAIVELLREELPTSKAWITFRFREDPVDNIFDMMNFARNCYHSLENQLIAIGVNCIDPRDSQFYAYINTFYNFSGTRDIIPLIVYPRKANLWNPNSWLPLDKPNEFSVSKLVNIGVRYLGGCCNVLPEDISTIRIELNKLNQLRQFQS